MLCGSAAGFDTYLVSLVKRGVSRSAYSPSRALPLLAKDIMNISRFFFYSEGSIAYVLRAATLIGYFSFLRQQCIALWESSRFRTLAAVG